MAKELNIEVGIKYNHLKIYIDGILHLSIRVQEIIGINSYMVGKHYHHIDFVTKDTIIESNYTRKDLWEEILKKLDLISII